MSRRGWLLFAAVGVIWGVPYLLIRISVRDFAPPALVFFRTAAAALVLAPIALRRHRLAELRPYWRPLLAYTVVELAVPWLFLFRAEQRLSSSLSGLLVACVPLLAVVVMKLARVESHLGARRLAGLLCGFSGVVVLVGVDVRGSDLIGVAEVAVVALGYAIGPFIVARHLAGAPSLLVVAASIAVTAIVYAPFGLTRVPHHLGAQVLASVVVLAVICTALAFLLFFALIAEVGPARSTLITYVNPAIALIGGIVFLHEHAGAGVWIGFPLILLGSYFGAGRLSERAGADEAIVVAAPQAEPSST